MTYIAQALNHWAIGDTPESAIRKARAFGFKGRAKGRIATAKVPEWVEPASIWVDGMGTVHVKPKADRTAEPFMLNWEVA